MGFLKKFFQTTKPTILELVPEPQARQPQIPPLSLPTKYLVQKELQKPNTSKPDGRVSMIEAHALSLGWTRDQLWKETSRRDLKGLASIIQADHTITAITPHFIQLERTSLTGRLEIQRFYNHNTDQPWLKRNSP